MSTRKKKVEKHPAHASESLHPGTRNVLNLVGMESDEELIITLRAQGNIVTRPLTFAQLEAQEARG